MRVFATALLLIASPFPLLAQNRPDGPANDKASKTYNHALDLLRKHDWESALDAFKKADKQDEGH